MCLPGSQSTFPQRCLSRTPTTFFLKWPICVELQPLTCAQGRCSTRPPLRGCPRRPTFFFKFQQGNFREAGALHRSTPRRSTSSCASLGEGLRVRTGRDLARTPGIISTPTVQSGGSPSQGPAGFERPKKVKKGAKDRDRHRERDRDRRRQRRAENGDRDRRSRDHPLGEF